MGKNKNANFSKSPHGPIFKFCVVIREAILQKMAPILDPVNFFSVLTLLGHCGLRMTLILTRGSIIIFARKNIQLGFVMSIPPHDSLLMQGLSEEVGIKI